MSILKITRVTDLRVLATMAMTSLSQTVFASEEVMKKIDTERQLD